MRNLLVLLLRYHAMLLFIALEIFSLIMVVNHNNYQSSAFFQASLTVRGAAFGVIDNTISYMNLQKVNDSLVAENARLKSDLLIQNDLQSKAQITRIPKLSTQNKSYIPVKIIGNSILNRNNYITLDKGSNDLIASDLGLINEKGVLGIIKSASPNFSSGISILHADFAVSAKIAELNQVGSIVWDGENYQYVQLQHIPRHVQVLKGQEIVVSQFSILFPENTPIGVIHDFSLKEGGAFYEIEVKLHNDMRNLDYGYVLRNELKKEVEELENKVKD